MLSLSHTLTITHRTHTHSLTHSNTHTATTTPPGADGLFKLWSVRTGECANTFDAHDDRVWALAAGGAHEAVVATGGADARVVIWCAWPRGASGLEGRSVLRAREQRSWGELGVEVGASRCRACVLV